MRARNATGWRALMTVRLLELEHAARREGAGGFAAAVADIRAKLPAAAPAPAARPPGVAELSPQLRQWWESVARALRGENPKGLERRRKRNPPVSSSRILDLLADAVKREKTEPGQGWTWTYFHVMTPAEHLAFDLWLVRMKDPLAWEAGTPEGRFRQRVQEMIAGGKAKRAGPPKTTNPRLAGEAAELFYRYHGYPPDKLVKLAVPKLDNQQMVFIGNLRRIDYDSPKWSRRKPGKRPLKGYWHESTGRPYILSNPQGNVLVIYDPSGQLRITPEGIER